MEEMLSSSKRRTETEKEKEKENKKSKEKHELEGFSKKEKKRKSALWANLKNSIAGLVTTMEPTKRTDTSSFASTQRSAATPSAKTTDTTSTTSTTATTHSPSASTTATTATTIQEEYAISQGCEVQLHPYNVVLFKRCLDVDNQLRLLKDCSEIMNLGDNPKLLERKKFTNSSKKAVPVLFWNWPKVDASLRYKEIYTPRPLLDLSHRLFDGAREKVIAEANSSLVQQANRKDMAFPPEYRPDALYGILYPQGGSFIPHVDGAKGWALAISVGESATFFVCETAESERYRIQIESGDAVIFKGGKLYHGVESIVTGSAPEFWYDQKKSAFPVFGMARFNLQFRDPERDRLHYYPIFQEIENPKAYPLRK